jgi:integrase
MKINYYLKSTKTKGAKPIFCRICFNGHKVKVYINESIKESCWNSKKQRAIETRIFPEHPEFNERMNQVDTFIRTTFRRLELANNILPPDPVILKETLSEKFRPKVKKEEDDTEFMSFFSKIIERSKKGIRINHRTGHPIHSNTIKTYNTVYNNILEYEKHKRKKLKFAEFDLAFYTEFNEWLMKEKKQSNNSVGKHIQIIKLVLNEASEMGVNTNMKFKNKRFFVIKEQTESIYLSEKEIQLIYNLDLSSHPKLEKTRDLFVIGCKTGLRFGDFNNIHPDQIKGPFIMIRQAKTGEPVTVPIHPIVQELIKKYKGHLPKAKVNQVVNRELKEIANMIPEFNELVEISATKSGKRGQILFKKNELISTHTARRSFCSNEYLAGTPSMSIMAISGHKTEKAFLRYIKVKSIDHATIIKEKWDANRKTI